MNISVFAIAMALWAVVLHVDASPVRARKWADQRRRRERAPAVGGRVIAARIRGPPRIKSSRNDS